MHKIIYFLRTSLYASWLGRSLRKCNGLRFWLRLGFSRFTRIQMQVLLFFCLLFLLLFSPVSQVSADLLQQITATVTGYPMFPSVTPEPTKNFTCPVGTPVGWGTVTPDPYWNLYCGVCAPVGTPGATGTPFPVSTFMIPLTQTSEAIYGTGTPYPTATITVTSTVSPAPTSASALLNLYSITRTNTGSPYITLNGSSYSSCEPTGSSNTYSCSGYLFGNDSNGVIGGSLQANHWVDPLIASGFQTIYYWFQIIPDAGNTTGDSVMGGVSKPGWSGSGSVSFQFNANANFRVSNNSSTGRVGGFGFTYQLYISAYPLMLTPSPTVTPTGTPGGYCSVVEGVPSDGGSEFVLPVPILGQVTCPVDFVGLDVPLYGVFGLPDLHIPALRVCFQDVDFGILTYYDVSLDVNYLAFILAAALIVRMFLK
ncbi:MAG: hypothetical protein Q8L41_04230 [Anaerolineales bacterium]|nr:hypothetical protein [Anaerolineales bacterium]